MSQYKVYTMGGTETTLMISGFTKVFGLNQSAVDIIQKATYFQDNVGQYQCFATNAYGEAQQNIMVDLASEFWLNRLSQYCSEGRTQASR